MTVQAGQRAPAVWHVPLKHLRCPIRIGRAPPPCLLPARPGARRRPRRRPPHRSCRCRRAPIAAGPRECRPSPRPAIRSFSLAALAAPVLAFVPPPLPTPARPTPPSGTSAVTSPIEVAEQEEEEESATESVSAQAVAYRANDDEPPVAYLLGVIALAALAGASIRGPRRGRRGVRVAPATISSMRAQRRLEGSARGRRG